MPVYDCSPNIRSMFEPLLRDLHGYLQVQRRPPPWESIFLPWERFDAANAADHSNDVSPLQTLANHTVQLNPSLTWIPVDKDSHRRVGIHWRDYLYRLETSR